MISPYSALRELAKRDIHTAVAAERFFSKNYMLPDDHWKALGVNTQMTIMSKEFDTMENRGGVITRYFYLCGYEGSEKILCVGAPLHEWLQSFEIYPKTIGIKQTKNGFVGYLL